MRNQTQTQPVRKPLPSARTGMPTGPIRATALPVPATECAARLQNAWGVRVTTTRRGKERTHA